MSDGTSPGRPRRRQVWHGATTMTVAALFAAACASAGSAVAAGSTNYQKAVAYAQCIRAQFQSARRTCLKPLSGVLP